MELIGEGGFGLVYVAEQQQPIRRRVALKLIKPGMDSREVIARFEAERQALALMDHPNIARVLDAGSTGDVEKGVEKGVRNRLPERPDGGFAQPVPDTFFDAGRPYFVMELVRGIPLTQFCDESRLSTRQRLELFIDVCNAVQHAHQKGVIHRDLKPSNVLVTLHDGTPVVKVIDFGVAKAMSEPLTEKTLYTRFAQMIGTPLYMSPEQAEMSGLDVDTRSDIYSLGVMLYELLTGVTPFDRTRFKALSFDDLRRIIREEEPPRPSARLTTLGQTLSTVSLNRRIEPRALSTLLRGDLDWIVMKALEKDRRRRYATAAEFAADLRRYLSGEPISARPPTLGYQFGKLARRNKVALTTGSIVLLALVLGTGVSVWQAIRATAAQSEADSQRQKAEEFAEHLKQANVLLDSARANADEGNYKQALAEYTKAAELQPKHYLVWSGRGSLYVRLGLWRLAATDYAEALRLGAPANNPGWWGVPQLCLYAGETEAYETARRTLRRQIERSNDAMAIRACVVGKGAPAEMKPLAERAKKLLSDLKSSPWPGSFDGRVSGGGGPGGGPGSAQFGGPPLRDGGSSVAGGPRPEPRGDRPAGDKAAKEPSDKRPDNGGFRPGPGRADFRPILQYIAGLACYRAGDFDRAIELLKSAVGDDQRWQASVLAYPVLAMAYHDSGKQAEADEALGKAKAALDGWIAKLAEGKSMPLPPWFDIVECLLLTREANQLILGQPLADDSRLADLERRGLATLEH